MRRILIVTSLLLFVGGACASASPEVPLGLDGQPDSELSMGREVYCGAAQTAMAQLVAAVLARSWVTARSSSSTQILRSSVV